MGDQPAETEGLTDEQISADEVMAAPDDEATDPDLRDPRTDRAGVDLTRETDTED